jgi:hypothetical protein
VSALLLHDRLIELTCMDRETAVALGTLPLAVDRVDALTMDRDVLRRDTVQHDQSRGRHDRALDHEFSFPDHDARPAPIVAPTRMDFMALEAAHDPKLASALLLLYKGKRLVSAILAQAVDRGEISATRDWSLVTDVIVAMGLLRVVGGQTVDADFVRQVIDTLILPAVRTSSTSKTSTTTAKPSSPHRRVQT